MSRAFRCDRCKKVFDGVGDLQAALNESLERLRCFVMGITFAPGADQASMYFKDLCPDCAKSFCAWFKNET